MLGFATLKRCALLNALHRPWTSARTLQEYSRAPTTGYTTAAFLVFSVPSVFTIADTLPRGVVTSEICT